MFRVNQESQIYFFFSPLCSPKCENSTHKHGRFGAVVVEGRNKEQQW